MQFLSLVFYDIKSRFSGSRLSFLWAITSPAVTIGIYWFVYRIALQGGDVDGIPYLPFLVAGILPWFFFSEGVTLCAGVYRDYGFLVKNIPFPLTRLPLMRVAGSVILHFLLLLISLGVLALDGVILRWGQIWVLFWMAGGFLLTLGLGRILALLNARCRDVGYGLGVVLQLGFWLTPVFWSPSLLPDWAEWLLRWNPVAALVEGYRQALLFGSAPDVFDVLILWGYGLVIYGVSCIMMKKEVSTLADRL